MSWAEVKKINDNMSIPLDQLFLKLIGGFHREYIYSSRTYEVPWDGIFTIRAYCGQNGQYGKVVKKFTKGELLTITITGNTSVTITSNMQANSVFHIQLNDRDANVNSNSADSIRAIAIGGAAVGQPGGNARVRSNNGIAAGGGGSGGGNNTSNSSNSLYYLGWAGGAAYAYGTNCYALGGGGGGGGNSSYNNGGGAGGAAYINGTALSNYCCTTSLISGKGYDGGNSHNTSSVTYGGEGGDGGCGGGCGLNRLSFNTSTAVKTVGMGYFSDGGYTVGGSARGGSLGDIADDGSSKNAITYANLSGSKGYFVGGSGAKAKDSNYSGYVGGTGGFLGGAGGNYWGSAFNGSGGKGGYSPYGIGGTGGTAGGTNNSYSSGAGGDGKLIGGNGGYSNGSIDGGTGGNGYYPGIGGLSRNGSQGSNGYAITSGIMSSSFPLKGMEPTTSIVIIEAGDSIEDF
ncbi:MAG: hypothetical protein J6T10_14645 [Methanobrevibacter sp.]|nr:hypothetical protein [Methanobrevibacter sp.]